MPLLHPLQATVEIARDVQDAMDFALPEQLLRLRHRHAFAVDGALPRGVELLQVAAAVGAVGEPDHRDRHLVHRPVGIDQVVEDRVEQAAHEEDDHGAGVAENELELVYEDAEPVAEPQAGVCLSLFHNVD